MRSKAVAEHKESPLCGGLHQIGFRYMVYELYKFEHDFEKAQKDELAINNSMPSIAFRDAWDLYQNTLSAPLKMQIFGRHVFTKSAQRNIGLGIGLSEVDNFGKANSRSSGSIQLLNYGDWNATINDVWLCAGIHGLHEFHPASPLNSANIFDKQFTLSVTGRELVGLAIAGYVPLEGHKALGRIYRPSITKNAEDFNLMAYREQIKKIESIDHAKRFFKDKGFNIV